MRLITGLILCSVAASAQTTFNKDILPLMQTACQNCHQPDKIAPMSLLTYDDVVTYADDIARVLTDKSMPPWKPVPGYGDFRHSYGISDAQRQMFLDWISNGMLVGDPADAPAPLAIDDSPWQLGTPDLVLQPSGTFIPSHDQADTYRCFSLAPGLTSSTYIRASQALPLQPQEVHHVLMLLDPTGESAALDGADGQPGYDCFGDIGIGDLSSLAQAVGALVGTWVPGAQVNPLDDGIGILIPANARIVMQVHYHPSGTSTPDQTSAGFYFSPPNSVQHRLLSLPLLNTTFTIPANNSNYEVDAKLQVPFFLSGKAVLILPHMHLLGRQIAVNLTDPSGTVTPLVRIDDWDFNWQGSYMYTTAIPIAGNSLLSLKSFYDNSDQNLKNPNSPIVDVKWGERTTDEMCIALVGVILDNEALLNSLF
jgi:hypothetical protein